MTPENTNNNELSVYFDFLEEQGIIVNREEYSKSDVEYHCWNNIGTNAGHWVGDSNDGLYLDNSVGDGVISLNLGRNFVGTGMHYQQSSNWSELITVLTSGLLSGIGLIMLTWNEFIIIFFIIGFCNGVIVSSIIFRKIFRK